MKYLILFLITFNVNAKNYVSTHNASGNEILSMPLNKCVNGKRAHKSKKHGLVIFSGTCSMDAVPKTGFKPDYNYCEDGKAYIKLATNRPEKRQLKIDGRHIDCTEGIDVFNRPEE